MRSRPGKNFRLFRISAFQYFSSVRLLAELFLVGLLVWLGWEKSFHTWTNQWRGVQPSPTPATAVAVAGTVAGQATVPRQPFLGYRSPPSTAAGQWMWDPAHRGTLDRPAHDSRDASQDYRDAGARNYWIDGQGVKHYTNAPAPGPSAP